MEANFIARYLKGVTSTATGMMIQILLGMIGIIIVARAIPASHFGAFVLIQVIALFFMILSGLLQESIAVTRYITTADEHKKEDAVNTAISCKVVIILAFCVIIFIIQPIIGYFFKEPELRELQIFIPVLFVMNSLDDILNKILQGLHLYKTVAISQIINACSKLTLILLFVVVLKMDVAGVVTAVVISIALSIGIRYKAIPFKKSIRFDHETIREISRFSYPLGFNGILTFVFTHLDNLMIAAMLSPMQVAYYSIASKIPENVMKMYSSFYSVFFPNMSELFANKQKAEAEKVLSVSIRSIALLLAFSAIGFTVFRKEIIQYVFSIKYMASAFALSVLMLTLCVNVVANMLGTTLVALGRADTPYKINLVTTSVNLLGNLIMIPRFGFMGAVYATFFASIVTHPVILLYLRKADIRIRLRYYLKPILLFLLSWGTYEIVEIEAIYFKLLIILFFVISCYLFSVVTKIDIQNAIKTINRLKLHHIQKREAALNENIIPD